MSAVNPLADAGTRVGRYCYAFAQNDSEVMESLALRHRIFVREMGAAPDDNAAQIETDALDDFCLHLIVRERASGAVVASMRILTHDAAIAAGQFYSADEFEMSPVLACPGRFMEVGRTCVDAAHRGGAAIAALWAGLRDLIRSDEFDHLIGCVSIDTRQGTAMAHAVYAQLSATHLADAQRQVRPRRALPPAEAAATGAVRVPPLIKAYLRLGAAVAGPPCWDPTFGVARLFMHLQIPRITSCHARRFPGHEMHARQHPIVASTHPARLANGRR